MNVKFKYELDQKIVTPFGEPGIIFSLGFDDGGITYFVKSANNSSWFKEKEITAESIIPRNKKKGK